MSGSSLTESSGPWYPDPGGGKMCRAFLGRRKVVWWSGRSVVNGVIGVIVRRRRRIGVEGGVILGVFFVDVLYEGDCV